MGRTFLRERDNRETSAVFVRAKYHTTEEWMDQDGNEFSPEQNYYVGGNTKFYGAALFRLRPEDFGIIQHHGGLSPAWPLSYEDFEPFYAEAERLYHVHGAAGEDPTDGPRSGDFPYPAVQHEPRIQALSDDLLKLGLHPSHLPLGVLLDQDEHGGALPPTRCRYPLQPGRRLSLPREWQGRRADGLRGSGARQPEPDASDRRARSRAWRLTLTASRSSPW